MQNEYQELGNPKRNMEPLALKASDKHLTELIEFVWNKI